MGSSLALAGQGAANQVFASTFWVLSFLPAVVTPLVAKASASGDKVAVQERIGEALFLGSILGIMGTLFLALFPSQALSSVLPIGTPAREFATPYLFIRALTFLPALLCTVGFASFRGSMDVVTPLKIAFVSNMVNMILDPILIFGANMGVQGAAAATCVCELVACSLYVRAMRKQRMIKVSKFTAPSMNALAPLLKGGLSVLFRQIAINIAFLTVVRKTQALDPSNGVAAAAHAITVQLWNLGGVILLALSSVATILIPSEIARREREGKEGMEMKGKEGGGINAGDVTTGDVTSGVVENIGDATTAQREVAKPSMTSILANRVYALEYGRAVANRLFVWGLFLGTGLGALQIACLPLLKVING